MLFWSGFPWSGSSFLPRGNNSVSHLPHIWPSYICVFQPYRPSSSSSNILHFSLLWSFPSGIFSLKFILWLTNFYSCFQVPVRGHFPDFPVCCSFLFYLLSIPIVLLHHSTNSRCHVNDCPLWSRNKRWCMSNVTLYQLVILWYPELRIDTVCPAWLKHFKENTHWLWSVKII